MSILKTKFYLFALYKNKNKFYSNEDMYGYKDSFVSQRFYIM